MNNKYKAMHFVGFDCCEPGLFDKVKHLRKTTNPADVTCSNCVSHMSKYQIEYRKQLLKDRQRRKDKLMGKAWEKDNNRKGKRKQ